MAGSAGRKTHRSPDPRGVDAILREDTRACAIAREFDAKAPHYESNRLAGWYKAHSRLILDHLDLGEGDVVLDVGCATGYLLRSIRHAHPNVACVGIDLSAAMIDTARRLAHASDCAGITFIEADWCALSDPAFERLDHLRPTHVIMASSLHYFPDPAAALARAHAILAPGGCLWLLERRLEGSPVTRLWDWLHRLIVQDNVRFHTTGALRASLHSAGFAQTIEAAKLNKLFWQGKLNTAMALLKASKPHEALGSAASSVER